MFVVKIDVIIAVYNAESTIEECVRSVLNQTIPNNLIRQLFSNDACLLSNDDDNCKRQKYTSKYNTKEDDIPLDDDTNVHFDICICCYNDASTDKSLDILHSLQRESMKQKEVQDDTSTSRASIQTKLLVGTAPKNTTSRGAGYARNQAIKLRDEYEKKHQQHAKEADSHFLCILDSDDVMHPTRIAEQTCAMLSISDVKVRERTLMGCQFERIPKGATHHYSQWANSLSYERLYLEQFRECTLLQPTWFISKAWFESLGGYVEAPVSGSSSNIDDDDVPNNNFYRLVHPLETIDPTTNTTHTNTLRLAEDTRLFYAHLHAGGKLHLHRTLTPLVTYRHRSGMSQSSNTPRKLLLRLRAKAWEDMIYKNNTLSWTNGFAIWGAGRDGKNFIKALSPEVAAKVVCFVDVDQKKIETVKWYENPALLGKRKIPILHFSVLSKDCSKSLESFGHIDKKTRREDTFNIVLKKTEPSQIETSAPKKNEKGKKKETQIDSEVLQQLPVVVCVAMYRTNGALEANVKSIYRTEGKDLWHII